MLDGIPLGHSIPAHVLFGWCSGCEGRDYYAEMNAWRLWAMKNAPEVDKAVSRNGSRS